MGFLSAQIVEVHLPRTKFFLNDIEGNIKIFKKKMNMYSSVLCFRNFLLTYLNSDLDLQEEYKSTYSHFL